MNNNNFINKVVKKTLNEVNRIYNLQPGQVGNRTFWDTQLKQYIATFPEDTSTYVLQYNQMTPQQRNIMGLLAECFTRTCEKVINTEYSQYFKNSTTNEMGFSCEDMVQEFLSGGSIKDLYKTKTMQPSKAKAGYGISYAIGKYLDNCKSKHVQPDSYKCYLWVIVFAKNFALKMFKNIYGAPDSLSRENLVLGSDPAKENYTTNDVFTNKAYNKYDKIDINSLRLTSQQKQILQCLVDVTNTPISPELLDVMSDLNPDLTPRDLNVGSIELPGRKNKQSYNKARTMAIYQEIGNRLNISPEIVAKRLSDIKKQLNPKPDPQPEQYSMVAESKYNDIYNKNNNMKKTITLTETKLRQLIYNVICESLSLPLYPAFRQWADKFKKIYSQTDEEINPKKMREFGMFVRALQASPIVYESIKRGVAMEDNNQKVNASKIGLNVDHYVNDKFEEILNGFLGGLLPQSDFKGVDDTSEITKVLNTNRTDEEGNTLPPAIITFTPALAAWFIYNVNSETELNTLLGKYLNTYAARYVRNEYNALMITRGMGNKPVDGGEDNGEGDESSKTSDKGMLDKPEDKKTTAEPTTNIPLSDYNKRLIAQARKVADGVDPNIHLTPQQKLILDTLLDIVENGVSPERLNKMYPKDVNPDNVETPDDEESTRKNKQSQEMAERMSIYDEIAQRLNLPLQTVQKRLSDIVNICQQSKRPGNGTDPTNESKKKMEQCINEAIDKVIRKYLK